MASANAKFGTKRFLSVFGVFCPVRRSQDGPILTRLCAIRHFPCKDVLFVGFADTALHLVGQIPPTNKGGNRHFQSKLGKYENLHISQTNASL